MIYLKKSEFATISGDERMNESEWTSLLFSTPHPTLKGEGQ